MKFYTCKLNSLLYVLYKKQGYCTYYGAQRMILIKSISTCKEVRTNRRIWTEATKLHIKLHNLEEAFKDAFKKYKEVIKA